MHLDALRCTAEQRRGFAQSPNVMNRWLAKEHKPNDMREVCASMPPLGSIKFALSDAGTEIDDASDRVRKERCGAYDTRDAKNWEQL